MNRIDIIELTLQMYIQAHIIHKYRASIVYISVCIWYTCTRLRLQVPVLVGVCSSRGRREAQGSLSVNLHRPLKQCLPLNLKLGW